MSRKKKKTQSEQASPVSELTARSLPCLLCEQERIIERLKEQRDRDEREKGEELDTCKKELKELKEKINLLQGDLSDREVRLCLHTHTHT